MKGWIIPGLLLRLATLCAPSPGGSQWDFIPTSGVQRFRQLLIGFGLHSYLFCRLEYTRGSRHTAWPHSWVPRGREVFLPRLSFRKGPIKGGGEKDDDGVDVIQEFNVAGCQQ